MSLARSRGPNYERHLEPSGTIERCKSFTIEFSPRPTLHTDYVRVWYQRANPLVRNTCAPQQWPERERE
jgi:hypothetical protein